jgi:hypothetical protein
LPKWYQEYESGEELPEDEESAKSGCTEVGLRMNATLPGLVTATYACEVECSSTILYTAVEE